MCSFFSFGVSKDGEVLAILGNDRENLEKEGRNPDSHTEIAEFYNLLSEDEMWKFDLNFTYEEFKNFVENPTLGKVKELVEKSYDGGLPLDEMPLPFLVKAVNFLLENVDEIKKAGLNKFCSNVLYNEVFFSLPPDKDVEFRLIQLFKPMTTEEVVNLLEMKHKTKTRWRNKNGATVYYRKEENQNIMYISICAYKHRWIDDNNEIKEEIRYNLHFQSFPKKL